MQLEYWVLSVFHYFVEHLVKSDRFQEQHWWLGFARIRWGGSLQCSADKLAGYDAREERGGAGLNTVKGGMGNDMLCLFIS